MVALRDEAQLRRNCTELCHASRDGHMGVVLGLLHGDRGGGLRERLNVPLEIDEENGFEDDDEPGVCAVHCAARAGHGGVITALAGCGADMNLAINSLFVSVPAPLFIAADSGHSSAVTALLCAKADPELCQPPLGWTALHAAAARGELGVIDALLDGGAWARPRDRDGLTPWGLVSQRLESLAPYRDAFDLERTLIGLGVCAPVSHEARMSGVAACPVSRIRELNALAVPVRERARRTLALLAGPLARLSAATQRLAWAQSALPGAVRASHMTCFSGAAASTRAVAAVQRWLSFDLLEAVGEHVGSVNEHRHPEGARGFANAMSEQDDPWRELTITNSHGRATHIAAQAVAEDYYRLHGHKRTKLRKQW